MQEYYGIDVVNGLEGKTGRWLRVRLLGLLDIQESRLYRTLFPTPTGEG